MQHCAGTVKKPSLKPGGTRRSLSLTTLTSRWRSRARSPRNTATPARLRLRQPHWMQDGVYDAFTKRRRDRRRDEDRRRVRAGCRGSARWIDMKAVEKVEAHIADAQRRAPRWSPAVKRAARRQLRADGVDRRDDRHGHHQGGDPAPSPRSTTSRPKTRRSRCQHRSPVSPPISTAARSAASGASRGPRIRHRRHQRRHHLDEIALRRHEGSGIGPIWRLTGAQNTASRILGQISWAA